MPSISQIFPRARAGLVLAGLAVSAAACAPVPYASYSAPDCRPFQQLVTVDGQQQTSYTTQCRTPDGSWRVVAQSNGTASAPATQPQSGTAVPLTSNPQSYAYGILPYDPGFDLSYAGYPYPYAYPYYYSDFYPGYFGPGFAVGFGFNRFAFNRSGFNRFRFNRFGHAGFGNRGQGGFAGGGFHGGGGGFGGGSGGHR